MVNIYNDDFGSNEVQRFLVRHLFRIADQFKYNNDKHAHGAYGPTFATVAGRFLSGSARIRKLPAATASVQRHFVPLPGL